MFCCRLVSSYSCCCERCCIIGCDDRGATLLALRKFGISDESGAAAFTPSRAALYMFT